MSRRRRSPRPLQTPQFGTPANGRQCAICQRWFHNAHFWRRDRKAFVPWCADCFRKTYTNTANSGKRRRPQPGRPRPKERPAPPPSARERVLARWDEADSSYRRRQE